MFLITCEPVCNCSTYNFVHSTLLCSRQRPSSIVTDFDFVPHNAWFTPQTRLSCLVFGVNRIHGNKWLPKFPLPILPVAHFTCCLFYRCPFFRGQNFRCPFFHCPFYHLPMNRIGDKSRQFSVVVNVLESEQFRQSCLRVNKQVLVANCKLGQDKTKLCSHYISRLDKQF